MTRVTNIKTLLMLEKAGHIELHKHTGTEVSCLNGSNVIATYIQNYKNVCFKHNGTEYHVKYVSGSFYPYVYYK